MGNRRNNLKDLMNVLSNVFIPIIGGIAAAVIAFKTITAITKAWAIAQAILNGTLAVNPLFLIAAGVALLVAGIILVIKNWDYLYNLFQVTIAKLSQYFKIFGSMIQESFTVAINKVKIAFFKTCGNNCRKSPWISCESFRSYGQNAFCRR